MNYARVRKMSLKGFLAFLAATALIAIVSVLSGEFGELQLKILATSLTISAASICSMSCAAFIEKKMSVELGLCGIFLSVCAGALVIIGMWPEIDTPEYWKATITLGVGGIGLAHAFLLNLPELDDSHRWVQRVSSVSIGVLAAQIVVAVWYDISDDGYYRLLSVVAIAVGLETLAVPIFLKLRRGNQRSTRELVLEEVGTGIYRDSDGRMYEVRETSPEQDLESASHTGGAT